MWFWKKKKTPPSKIAGQTPLARLREIRAMMWDSSGYFSMSKTMQEIEEIESGLAPECDIPEVRGEIAYAYAYLFSRQRDAENSNAQYRIALDSHEIHPFLLEKQALSARMEIALNLGDLNAWNEAVASMEEVLPDVIAYSDYDENQAAGCQERMAFWLHEAGNFEKAKTLNLEVIKTGERLFGSDAPELMVALTNLAQNFHGLGQHDAARPFLERTLGIARSGGDEYKVHQMLFQLGVLAHEQERFDAAEAHFKDGMTHAQGTQDSWLIDRAQKNLDEFYTKCRET